MPYIPPLRRSHLAGATAPRHVETVVRADGSRIEMRLWQGVRGLAYFMEYRRGAERLLCYEGDLREATRSRHGRAAPYAFRSIEQLRYDFERDLEGIEGGDEAQA